MNEEKARELCAVVVTTADPPPFIVVNRLLGEVIGIALRIGRRRQLSVVWRQPSRAALDRARNRKVES